MRPHATFCAGFHPCHLGATLYVPATRSDLVTVARGRRWPDLRSLVIDLEDAVADRDVERAEAGLADALPQLECADGPLVFVRARDADMLERLVELPGIANVTGFVLPKVTPDTLPRSLAALLPGCHAIMPTIETRDAFDPAAMRRLREQLTAVHDRVPVVRIGGNDLLQLLGCRRAANRTAYDGPLGRIIADLVATFVPWGFAMSAPVMERFDAPALLAEEVERDLEHGLVTKTAIHPDQVAMIHRAYAVASEAHANALRILAEDAPAAFASDGTMSEPATHRGWARAIIERARVFGIVPAEPLALVG